MDVGRRPRRTSEFAVLSRDATARRASSPLIRERWSFRYDGCVEKLECIGGPYDGKSIRYVGPECRVPLAGGQLVRFVPKELPSLSELDAPYRVGIYRKLYAEHDGHAAYVWEPTPEVQSFYP